MSARLIYSLVIGFYCLLSGCAVARDVQSQRKPSTQLGAATKIVMLGTGTPNPDPDRSGPCVAIISNGHAYLIDCGAGVVRRAAAAQKSGIEALDAKNLDRLFITHLHSDHTIGLPDLILTPWVMERDHALEIYGPPGIKVMTDHIFAAYSEDIHIRLDGLQPANATGYHSNVHEVGEGEVYRDDNVRVRAFSVTHGSWSHALGYRFDAPDRSIVISGDTTPCDRLVEVARGCDVLIHEVYSAERFKSRPADWQRYHAASHTSTIQLAEIANKVHPKLLILYHQLFWGGSDDDLVKEIKQHYDGPVISARDLDVY